MFFFIKELKPTLNTQSDSIRAVIFIARSTLYIFFLKSFLSYCYLAFFIVFYHLPFVTLSTYFIAFHILVLENDLSEIDTS